MLLELRRLLAELIIKAATVDTILHPYLPFNEDGYLFTEEGLVAIVTLVPMQQQPVTYLIVSEANQPAVTVNDSRNLLL